MRRHTSHLRPSRRLLNEHWPNSYQSCTTSRYRIMTVNAACYFVHIHFSSWLCLRPLQVRSHHENRSPFGLRYGTSLSSLLFSPTRSDSVAGACLVGAGSLLLASWLGEPALSVLAGPPFVVAEEADGLDAGPEYSRECTSCFFLRACSSLALRSALISCLAK